MKFIHDEPALLLDESGERTVVISDLHLGIEYEIYRKGISIPPRMERQKERIMKLLDESEAERLMLLGDVKHNVPNISIGEKERLPGFFSSLSERVEVHIAKGNHDGRIEKLSGDVKVHPTSGFRDGSFYFLHGHAWPTEDIFKARTLVMGHSHPALEFKDSLGFTSTVPCWLKGGIDVRALEKKLGKAKENMLENFVIVPAFNELIGGMPVNRRRKESLLGPLLTNKIIDLEEANSYLLDGTYLGKVKDLEN